MPSGRIVNLKGYKIDKKTGKPVKSSKGKSVSRRIAEAKKPKVTYKRRGMK